MTVHVTPHPMFTRRGDDLLVKIPITFPEAALGATVSVPTTDGPKVGLKVPPGTSTGKTLRVRGKGAPRKDGSRGDLLVTLEVAVPQSMPPAAEKALKAYAEATQHDPRAHLSDGVV